MLDIKRIRMNQEEIKEAWVYRDTIARRSKGKIPLEFKEDIIDFD